MKPLLTRFVLIFVIGLWTPLSIAVLPGVDAQGNPFPSLAPMLKNVNPAVVNIATFSTQQQAQNPLLNDPFFRRFFNIPDDQPFQQPAPQKRQQSAGSGVIVDADNGIVMTNYHVINGADEIRVSLIDGRAFDAELVGSDPDLDVAIIKVDAKDLSHVDIADSNQLEVGDFVVAIGNPFGLGQTVTTGIVSALGRSGLGIEGYENFIQTDASINPGNSGGALVNLKGELVGINTAIIAPAGGNVGIGFAIPINMARASMQQILEHGEVRRGLIGIGIQEITPELREAFGIVSGQSGVLVSNVFDDSPAQKAGIKAGDVILEVDGEKTMSTGQLRSRIGMKAVGDSVELKILRDGDVITRRVDIGKPETIAETDENLNVLPLLQGVQFENSPDGGVRVVSLQPDSRAANSGLKTGDVIIAANKQRVRNLNEFREALKLSKDSVLLRVNRNNSSLFIVIR